MDWAGWMANLQSVPLFCFSRLPRSIPKNPRKNEEETQRSRRKMLAEEKKEKKNSKCSPSSSSQSMQRQPWDNKTCNGGLFCQFQTISPSRCYLLKLSFKRGWPGRRGRLGMALALLGLAEVTDFGQKSSRPRLKPIFFLQYLAPAANQTLLATKLQMDCQH